MCVRFSSAGRYIASGADDRALAVWELQPGQGSSKVWGSSEVNVEVWKPIRMLPGHENDILSVAWSDDDRFLASAGVDTMVLVWDGETFAPIYKLAMHTGFVKGLAFDPVGQFLASQVSRLAPVVSPLKFSAGGRSHAQDMGHHRLESCQGRYRALCGCAQ
jgi:protein HIRA/HIR1